MSTISNRDLQDLLDVGIALSGEQDMTRLFDLILLEARRLTTADAATLYLVEDGMLHAMVAQCQTLIDRLGAEPADALFRAFRIAIDDHSIAGACALRGEIINIPDVQNLPAGTPFHYNPAFDRANDYATHSNLAVPMLDRNGTVVGVLQLINARDAGRVVPFDDAQIKIARALGSQAGVALCNARLTEDLLSAHLDTLQRLGVAAEWRDKETANHIVRVSHYCRILAEGLGWSKPACETLMRASHMHDVGKVGVPDAILNKPGRLDPVERAVMELHCVIGADILSNPKNTVMEMGRQIALGHHEKVDGTGYPNRLRGAAIPWACRIAAVADVFDALCSRRVYKPPFADDKVHDILRADAGTHFDPEVIEVFFSAWPSICAVRERWADSSSPENDATVKDAILLAQRGHHPQDKPI